IGFDAAWCGLRAADVGAAHGRFRVFILAWPSDGYPAGLVEERRDGEGNRGGRSETPARNASCDRGATDGAVTLLPTPDAYAGSRGGAQDPVKRAEGGHAISLADVAEHAIHPDRLLPTPRTENNENRQSSRYGGDRGNYHGLLTGTVDWGEYADAIDRWERVLGRAAPAPTEPGPKGN